VMYPIAGALCQTHAQSEHRTTATELIRTELHLLDGDHLREILTWLEQAVRCYQNRAAGCVKELDIFCLSGDGTRLQANEQFVAPMRASVSASMSHCMQSEAYRLASLKHVVWRVVVATTAQRLSRKVLCWLVLFHIK